MQGHEGCGEIIEVGDKVKDSRFKIVSGTEKCFSDRHCRLTRAICRATPSLCWLSPAVVKTIVSSALKTCHNSAQQGIIQVLDRMDSTPRTLRWMFEEQSMSRKVMHFAITVNGSPSLIAAQVLHPPKQLSQQML